MIFISEDPETHVVRAEVPAVYDTQGRMIAPKQRRITIKFQRGYAPQWVKDVALRTFEFRKRPVEIPAETWVSSYDSLEDQSTQGWTDEERQEIERVLLQAPGVLQVEEPKLAKPWPSIDKLTITKTRDAQTVAAEMTRMAAETGVDLGDVAAYVGQNVGRNGWTAELATLLRGAQADLEPTEDLVPA